MLQINAVSFNIMCTVVAVSFFVINIKTAVCTGIDISIEVIFGGISDFDFKSLGIFPRDDSDVGFGNG